MKPIQLSNPELLDEVKRLAGCEREATADLIIHLAEVERRELHHAEGFSSMFSYCTRVLSLSEDAAILRLRAMRAVRRRPEILADLTSGALNLSTIRLLEPYLTSANAVTLLASARHKGKREVEKLVRAHDPLPDVADSVRKLPSLRMQTVAAPQFTTDVPTAAPRSETAASAATPLHEGGAASEVQLSPHPRASVIAPLGPARYKVQFTAPEELHAKLLRARELLRHRIPSGDLAQVMDLALDALLERLEKQKYAATSRPRRQAAPRRHAQAVKSDQAEANRAPSRAIPAAVKRAVWERDGGRCAFIGASGHSCGEAGFVEFHHRVPFADEGEATVENIALRCRAHNQYEARLDFGPDLIREREAEWVVNLSGEGASVTPHFHLGGRDPYPTASKPTRIPEAPLFSRTHSSRRSGMSART